MRWPGCAGGGADALAGVRWRGQRGNTKRTRPTIRPAPRTLLGKTHFHKAEQACKPTHDFATTSLSMIREEYGRKDRMTLPKKSMALLLSGVALSERRHKGLE